VSDELSFIHPTDIPIFESYGYPSLSYVLINLITLLSPGTFTVHVPCHVTYHRAAKVIHIFEIPDSNLSLLWHFDKDYAM